jgi:outer membrane protein
MGNFAVHKTGEMRLAFRFILVALFASLFLQAQTGNAVHHPASAITTVVMSDSIYYPSDNTLPWTLQQCVSYALVHNISMQQQQLNIQLSQVNLRQSQAAVLPNLNGYASHTYQYGRTIDRFTNTFANSMVLSDNFYLSSSVTIFSGLQNYNSIKQNQYNLQSSAFQLEQMQNDLAMNIAGAYLQVLYALEQQAVAEQQVVATKLQVDRQQKLVDANAVSREALLNLQSQLASEEVNRITAENNSIMAYLSLTQFMNLDSTKGFTIVRPAIEVTNESILSSTPDQIYQTALSNQASIKKTEADYQSADKGVDLAYGALSPSVTLQGSVGTGYSGAAKNLDAINYAGYDTTGVTSGGDFVLTPNYTATYSTTPFADQFNNNVNKSFGVQVNVPIFNRLQTSSNIQRAKIQLDNAELNMQLAEQQLRKNIEQAWADARAAYQQYQANQKAVTAAEEAFHFAEQKLNSGASNTVDYNNAKNQLAKAQASLIQSKYDYIFRLKVLDFYQGKPITF